MNIHSNSDTGARVNLIKHIKIMRIIYVTTEIQSQISPRISPEVPESINKIIIRDSSAKYHTRHLHIIYYFYIACTCECRVGYASVSFSLFTICVLSEFVDTILRLWTTRQWKLSSKHWTLILEETYCSHIHTFTRSINSPLLLFSSVCDSKWVL